MKVRYAIICHVCVEEAREQTIHLMKHPLAKACREHLKVGRLRRDYSAHGNRRRGYRATYVERHHDRVLAAQRKYNASHRDQINRKMREQRQRNSDEINRRRRERYAARKKSA